MPTSTVRSVTSVCTHVVQDSPQPHLPLIWGFSNTNFSWSSSSTKSIVEFYWCQRSKVTHPKKNTRIFMMALFSIQTLTPEHDEQFFLSPWSCFANIPCAMTSSSSMRPLSLARSRANWFPEQPFVFTATRKPVFEVTWKGASCCAYRSRVFGNKTPNFIGCSLCLAFVRNGLWKNEWKNEQTTVIMAPFDFGNFLAASLAVRTAAVNAIRELGSRIFRGCKTMSWKYGVYRGAETS